jgi:Leucine-rich repeat (LRR) protein
MKTRNVLNTSLGKFFQFLSMSISVVVVLAGINLQQVYARSLAELQNAPTAFCDSVTEIPKSECEALVALYNSTGGANWIIKDNWLVTTTPGDWYGVTVSGGHVSYLDPMFNNLTGTIPPELGNLTALWGLDLGGNQLIGSIPPALGNLTALQGLYLSTNQLTGSIPPALGNLTALQGLYLYENQLTGSIPPELGNLTSLEVLALESNQLTGSIPAELGNLTALQGLALESNQLTGSIPLSFVNLSILENFYFQDTNLCEPTAPEYLAWKTTVSNYQGTGVSCETADKGYSIFLPSMQM